MEDNPLESVITLVGNIVNERSYGPGGLETKRGVRLFSAGAKVYMSSLTHWWALQDPSAKLNKEESITVIGLHRKSRALIRSYIKVKYITNIRLQIEYKPSIVARLKKENWPAFNFSEDSFVLSEDRTSQLEINAFLEVLYRHQQPLPDQKIRN